MGSDFYKTRETLSGNIMNMRPLVTGKEDEVVAVTRYCVEGGILGKYLQKKLRKDRYVLNCESWCKQHIL